MNPTWLASFEARFRTEVDAFSSRLQAMFPRDRFHIEANPWGRATGADGYIVALSCILSDAAEDAPDSVALEVSFSAVGTAPQAIADVCWGHPSGFIETQWRPDVEAVPFDAAAQEDLFEFLPQLKLAFERAVKNRGPNESHV